MWGRNSKQRKSAIRRKAAVERQVGLNVRRRAEEIRRGPQYSAGRQEAKRGGFDRLYGKKR